MAGELTASQHGGSNPDLPFWDLWWTNWHWCKFFTEYFNVRLSVLRVNISFISCRQYITVAIDKSREINTHLPICKWTDIAQPPKWLATRQKKSHCVQIAPSAYIVSFPAGTKGRVIS